MKVNLEHTIQSGERLWTIDWHPNGSLLASAGHGKVITLYKYKNQQFSKHSTIDTQHSKTVRCVKFSNKGDKIAASSFDATISVYIYNEQSNDFEFLSTLEGHQNQVKCVSWSNDDKKIATCSRDKNIWIWDFDNISYEYVCDAVLEGHTQDVKFVEWFRDEQNKLISASYDNTIRIWQGQDDDYVCKQVLEGHKSIVWNVQISGNYLFSCSQDCTVVQWRKDANGIFTKQKIYVNLHSLPIYTIAVSKKGHIITGSGDNTIKVEKISENEEEIVDANEVKNTLKLYHQSDVNCVKIHPKEENIFASCSDDERIKIWKFYDEKK